MAFVSLMGFFVFDMVAEYENRLEYAKEHSVLPNKPNIKKIDKFLIDANMSLFE